MSYYQVMMKQMAEGNFVPVYLIYGEEKFLHEELVRQLVKTFLGKDSSFGQEKLDGAELAAEELIARLGERSLFSERRLLIVENPPYILPPRKNEGTMDEEDKVENAEKFSKYIALLDDYLNQKFSNPPQSILVFTAERVDRRKRLYKLIGKKGVVIECLSLKGDDLVSWIQGKVAEMGKKIDHSALDRLLLAGDQNLHYLSCELEKYCTYLGQKEDIITSETIDLLFSGDIQGDVFKMSDAMAEDNLERAQEMLNLLLRKREKPLLIFFMLVRHYRLLLQAHCLLDQGLSQNDFTSALAVHPFVARKLRQQVASYNRVTLEDIMLALQKVDLQIKTGSLEPAEAIKLLLSRIADLQQPARSVRT